MRKVLLLKKTELNKFLKTAPDWRLLRKDTVLERVVQLDEYLDGLLLSARIAIYAEVNQHHPDITWSFDKLVVKTTSHDAKGLTKKDLEFAQAVERIIMRYAKI